LQRPSWARVIDADVMFACGYAKLVITLLDRAFNVYVITISYDVNLCVEERGQNVGGLSLVSCKCLKKCQPPHLGGKCKSCFSIYIRFERNTKEKARASVMNCCRMHSSSDLKSPNPDEWPHTQRRAYSRVHCPTVTVCACVCVGNIHFCISRLRYSGKFPAPLITLYSAPTSAPPTWLFTL
jgi:hypothetical protein